jgi:diphosphomevalonate decarboxylase
MEHTVARANGNLPLIQSWGLREPTLNLPYTGSLSLTLEGCASQVTWENRPDLPADRFTVDERPASGPVAEHLRRFVDLIRGRAARTTRCAVAIRTPAGGMGGVGGTTAAVAALALAGSAALELPTAPRALSMLARLGTSSAARSVFGGFVEGLGGELGDGSDCYAEPLAPPSHWPLAAVIAVVERPGAAPASAHELKRSPFFPAWLEAHEDDLGAVREAVRARDLERLGTAVEHHCLMARAVALAARPSIITWAPATLAAIERIQTLRAGGRAAYFTVAAGPHVTALCAPPDAAAVAAALEDTPGVARVLRSGPGEGAALVRPA